jgi:serine/threonine-protein kinase
MRARFDREARIIARLQHPAHVPIIDYGVEGAGLIYLVLEYVQGRPLRQVLEAHGPMSPRRTVEIAVQVLGLLAEAHALGLVHRDIKPSNIMVTRGALGEDQAHLLDFGFAKILYGDQAPFGDGAGSLRTRRGLVLGTPLYMSPEQATGRNVGPASDLYSLGIVLYKMLSGRTPFPGRDPISVLAAHRRQPPPPLPAAAGAPKRLGEAIERALAKDPADRFASAVEMAEALRFSVSRHFGWTPPVSDLAPPVPVEDVGLDDSLPDPMESDGDGLGPESVLAESESPISLMLDIVDEPDANDASAGISIVSAQALGGGPVIVALADFDPFAAPLASPGEAAVAQEEEAEVVAVPLAEADDVTERRPASFDDEEDRLFSLTMDDLASDTPAPRPVEPEAVAAVAMLREALADDPGPAEPVQVSRPATQRVRRAPAGRWVAAAAVFVAVGGAWVARHLPGAPAEAQVVEAEPAVVTVATEVFEVEAIPAPPEADPPAAHVAVATPTLAAPASPAVPSPVVVTAPALAAASPPPAPSPAAVLAALTPAAPAAATPSPAAALAAVAPPAHAALATATTAPPRTASAPAEAPPVVSMRDAPAAKPTLQMPEF